MIDFKNKKILITGATGGIGGALVKKFVSLGGTVLGTGTKNEKLELIKKNYPTIKVKKFNISEHSAIEEFIDSAASELGGLDILVNNAGVAQHGDIEEYNDVMLNRIMDTNVDSVFRMCRSAITPMKKQKSGVILNIGSISGLVSNIPQPQVAYNASKAAVHMLTKSLASDFAEYNIRVNAIAPGYIKTPMTKLPKENEHWYDIWNQMTPMNRMGEPEEIASAALFLCSSASSYVSGEVLVVDGAYTTR